MVGGSRCGEGCLVWIPGRFSSSLSALTVTKGPQGMRSRQFPQGESKGTALGLVKCQSRGHLPNRRGILRSRRNGRQLLSPLAYFDRCSARSRC